MAENNDWSRSSELGPGGEVLEGGRPDAFGGIIQDDQRETLDDRVAREVQEQMQDTPPGFEPYQDPGQQDYEQGGDEPIDVVEATRFTAQDQQNLDALANEHPGFYAAAPQMREAIDALSAEFGPTFGRQVLKNPEALLEVYEALGGDQEFGKQGADYLVKQGIHNAGNGSVFT